MGQTGLASLCSRGPKQRSKIHQASSPGLGGASTGDVVLLPRKLHVEAASFRARGEQPGVSPPSVQVRTVPDEGFSPFSPAALLTPQADGAHLPRSWCRRDPTLHPSYYSGLPPPPGTAPGSMEHRGEEDRDNPHRNFKGLYYLRTTVDKALSSGREWRVLDGGLWVELRAASSQLSPVSSQQAWWCYQQ